MSEKFNDQLKAKAAEVYPLPSTPSNITYLNDEVIVRMKREAFCEGYGMKEQEIQEVSYGEDKGYSEGYQDGIKKGQDQGYHACINDYTAKINEINAEVDQMRASRLNSWHYLALAFVVVGFCVIAWAGGWHMGRLNFINELSKK